ncbi:MAG: hypothetical protein JOZ74_00440 [Bradyrhizobium sp.]|nr:hypothetical protein [Bradyrhizobium sp.]
MDAVASAVFGDGAASPAAGAAAVVSALVVEAAVAIAAAAIESGALELPAVEAGGELVGLLATGINAATGFCTMAIVSTGLATAAASLDWLLSVEPLSEEELSRVFELSDFVLLLPLLLCAGALPLLL